MFISMEQLSSNIDFLHLRQRSKRVPAYCTSHNQLQQIYEVTVIFLVIGHFSLYLSGILYKVKLLTDGELLNDRKPGSSVRLKYQ